NPHCVMIVDDVEGVDVETIALRIQQSNLLPNQANIGFMQIISRNEINLRVYERGSGETLACGSGACAAVIHGVRIGQLDHKVTAHLRGGDALIEYNKGEHVFLSGPAQFVFEGWVDV
ncbi:MAG: diaminopimelate epimerase, partial [Candidatus Thioglobus sp.]|nr:diaminopimelate epimerase [Candidatus Thioglobus sp.]